MAYSAMQRYLAEFLGTFALLLLGGGSAVFSLGAIDPNSRVVLVSLAIGLVILAVVYAFGDVSGGHFNPAVTLSMWVSKRMPTAEVLPYLGAQILGGLVGILVVLGIVHGYSGQYALAQAAALGSQCYAGNGSPCAYNIGSVFLLEVALTFVFVLVIQIVTRPESSTKNLAPIAIGLTLLVANLAAIPVDGASINPVRSFSPALVSAVWSSSQWAIQQAWLFWVAPIVGGLLAAGAEMGLRGRP